MTSHPLTRFVLEILAKDTHLDRIKLANILSGGNVRGLKHYAYVADDVLGCMKEQGLITEDAQGWSVSSIAAQLAEE